MKNRKTFAVVVYIALVVALTKSDNLSDKNADVYCCAESLLMGYDNVAEMHYCRNLTDGVEPYASKLPCNKTKITLKSLLDFRVNSQNQLELPLRLGFWEPEFEAGHYCIGMMVDDDNITTVEGFVICAEPEDTSEEYSDHILPYCMIVSVIFLVLTGIIYAALPELRDLQGKSIVSFCFSLALALTFLIVMSLVVYEDYDLCTARGFFAYYFTCAAFFWMNAISIQIYKSIRNSSMNTYGWREYMWYGAYAWGTPGVLTVILAILNYAPGTHKRPGIGLNTCFFYDIYRQWLYLYSVMTILTVINILIFLYILITLWRNSFSSTHLRSIKYKFLMTIKLAIVMGLPWIFEMITSLSDRTLFTMILDVFNTLQGFFIFLVLVVFRVRVIKALSRHNLLCCISDFVEQRLAMKDDEEEDIIHTIAVPLEETNGLKPQIIARTQ